MEICTEISFGSLCKRGQELCGDKVEVWQDEEESIIVFSDGLGSGVKANILATLTSKIVMTMVKEGAGIDEIIETLMATLPVCKERKLSYSTFTVLRVKKNGTTHLVEYDNPDVIFIRNGKELNFKKNEISFHGKKIKESTFKLIPEDVCLLMSDGSERAGPNQFLSFAWKREGVLSYAMDCCENYNSPFAVKTALLQECNALYRGEIRDDSTFAICKIQYKNPTHVMIGPPADICDDENVVNRFMDTSGKKIICGGMTSQIVGKLINKKVRMGRISEKTWGPPTSFIDEIDLVTEGVLTLGKTVELMKNIEGFTIMEYSKMKHSENGAEQLAWTLMESGKHVDIFLGMASNLAHNKHDSIKTGKKIKLVEELAQELKLRGKTVKISCL